MIDQTFDSLFSCRPSLTIARYFLCLLVHTIAVWRPSSILLFGHIGWFNKHAIYHWSRYFSIGPVCFQCKFLIFFPSVLGESCQCCVMWWCPLRFARFFSQVYDLFHSGYFQFNIISYNLHENAQEVSTKKIIAMEVGMKGQVSFISLVDIMKPSIYTLLFYTFVILCDNISERFKRLTLRILKSLFYEFLAQIVFLKLNTNWTAKSFR